MNLTRARTTLHFTKAPAKWQKYVNLPLATAKAKKPGKPAASAKSGRGRISAPISDLEKADEPQRTGCQHLLHVGHSHGGAEQDLQTCNDTQIRGVLQTLGGIAVGGTHDHSAYGDALFSLHDSEEAPEEDRQIGAHKWVLSGYRVSLCDGRSLPTVTSLFVSGGSRNN